jgi:hypothetical protein
VDDMDVTSSMSEAANLDQRLDRPLLHTVDEAAEVLRIGRTLAYKLAQMYQATGGSEGLPVIRLGGCLRVPRWALLELVYSGRVVALSELAGGVTRSTSGRASGGGAWDSAPQVSARRVQAVAGVSRARRQRGVRPLEQLVLIPGD